jgi:dihydroneopterin aldolase
MPMDTIFISQLRIETIIGVYAEERLAPQLLLMDVEFTLNTAAAALSDQVADTVDYAALAQKIQVWSDATSFHLVEALAQHLAEKILETYKRIEQVCLVLQKFPVGLPVAGVGVKMTRQRLD